jgi:hypothetical protein
VQILRLLQTVDRRYLYALLLMTVVLPFFLKLQLPVTISPETEALYGAVEELPDRSFVLLGIDWAAGTRGENGPQTIAIIRHLMRKHLRFGILCFGDAQSKTLGEEISADLSKDFGYQEGRDWVNFGYQVDQANYLKAFVLNIQEQVKVDIHSTPLGQLPVMEGIKTARDIRLVIEITPSTTYAPYIQFVQGPYNANLKMGMACTSVMAPEAYNYFDSKQFVGLVAGLTGATEYEARYAQQYDPAITRGSRVTRFSNSLSFAHLLIIFFIILGNVAMLLERRARNAAVRGGRP